MKTNKILLTFISLSVTFSACKKFVDIKNNSAQTFITTANDCQEMLDNYPTMNTGYPVDGEISADNYYVTGATYSLSSIPQEERDLYGWNPAAQRVAATPNWQNPYLVVYYANLVLETLSKLEDGKDDPAVLNNLKGTALFYRAYAHWHVAQLYCNAYTTATAGNDPGIPLRLSSDINGKSSRGTVQDTYNRILQDLNDAVNLLNTTSSVPTRPNKAAAYAMLARTYLSMADYPNALVNADAAIKLKGDLLDYNSAAVNKAATSNTPFPRYNIEVIFQSLIYNKTSAPIGGAILAPGIASTNVAKIDPVLVASYAANDLRSKVFLKANSGTHAGTYRFTGNYEPASTAIFFNGLAVDELYLTRAECYARAEKVAEAVKDLNDLLNKRWVTGTYIPLSTTITAQQALGKILEERRKELLMRGLRWTDLRRLNRELLYKKDLQRSVTTGIAPNQVTTTFTLPANDPRYILLIPQEVMNYAGIAQNKR